MKRFIATFSAITQIPVEADNEDMARKTARAVLDPDVDWDCDGIDDVTDNRDMDWMFDK